ncbi:MAG: iron-sulfur cluster-binding protein [Saprospiraceae bacterium]|nr:iron-sulfur cluster-binding protein [Saprospiraceae bacterium]
MTEVYNKFIKDTNTIPFDLVHRNKIKFNISKYYAAVDKGMPQYSDLEKAKNRASKLKRNVINNLDKYLVEFEANFQANGGKIIWAQDAQDAIDSVKKIIRKYDAKLIVKSKSMTTEEIDFNEYIESSNIEVLETDLGEYIVQLDNDKPYHIVTPAMHKSKEDIAELFNKKFNTPIDYTPEQLTEFVRKLLRDKFIRADIGVTGGNFLIADTGAVALTENEGNALMSFSMPKIHIAIVGIEKVIPSIKDMDLFWSLLSTHGTGQKITVYNSIISGPRKENEVDGPDEMYVILLDNGRTNLLKHEEQRVALTCIRCGACLNFCPVYKNIGGHAYGTTYSGPIGAVITPHLKPMEEYKHLSFASSLCGACTEICPVKINLHKLLLLNRRDVVNNGFSKKSEKFTMSAYKIAMKNRWMIDLANSSMKNMALKLFFKKTWGPRRELPLVHKKSFNKRWKEERE